MPPICLTRSSEVSARVGEYERCWLAMLVMPMAGAGLFGLKFGIMAPVMTLMLHIIFGAVLGWGLRTERHAATGNCHDGINPRGLNLNPGAESVLASQHATCAMRALLVKAA